MKDRKNTKTEFWPLARLKDNPQQHVIFGDLPEAELDALAEDMKKKGQRTEVEILPDGTIITGHQRVRAARKLGWTEIEVIVRHDLAEAGPAAVEEHFITDNLVRRQLGPLGKARCLKRLMEIGTGDKSWGLNGKQVERLKTEIGKRLGIELRSVNRYLRVLQTPPAVQAAFGRGELILTVADKVAGLAKNVQTEIARRIDAGEQAAKVVAEYLDRPDEGDVGRAFGRVVGCLARELPRIGGQAAAIKPASLQRRLGLLEQARVVLAELADHARGNRSRGA